MTAIAILLLAAAIAFGLSKAIAASSDSVTLVGRGRL